MSRVNGSIQRETADGKLYYFQGANNVEIAKTSDLPTAITLGAFGSTPNANGLTLTAGVLNAEPASALFPGGVTTGSQTFAGTKSFAGNIILPANSPSILGTQATGVGNMQIGTQNSNALNLITDNTTRISISNNGITTFNSIPLVGTASPGTNTTAAASTAFVQNALGSYTGLFSKTGSTISPTTANDLILNSTTANSVSSITGSSTGVGSTGVTGNATSSNGTGVAGNSSTGVAGYFTGGGSSLPSLRATNTSTGNIQEWFKGGTELGRFSNSGDILLTNGASDQWFRSNTVSSSVRRGMMLSDGSSVENKIYTGGGSPIGAYTESPLMMVYGTGLLGGGGGNTKHLWHDTNKGNMFVIDASVSQNKSFFDLYAPTAAPGTNTTQVATTAFVQSALSGVTNYWQRNSGTATLSPVTANDKISVSSNSGISISATATQAGASAIYGLSSGGSGVVSESSSAVEAGFSAKNSSSGPIAILLNSSATQATFQNNGRFNWGGATATTTAGWDASKNLVSITNTGTGDAVRATSPTLVTPNIGVATGTSLALTGSSSTPLNVQTDAGGNGIAIARSNGANALIFIGGGNAAGSTFNVAVGPTNSFGLNGSGSFYISALGTGSVIASAGVLSVSSDSRIKNVRGPFKGSALKAINNIPLPKYWEYNKKSGLPKEAQEVKQFGLLADKIHPILGEEFAPTQKDGTYSLSDRALLSLTIQALQEATKRIEELEYKLNKP